MRHRPAPMSASPRRVHAMHGPPGAPRRSRWGALALALPAWAALGVFFLLPLVLMLGVSGAERAVYGGLRPGADLAAYLRSGGFLANYRPTLEAPYLRIPPAPP